MRSVRVSGTPMGRRSDGAEMARSIALVDDRPDGMR